MGTAVLTMRGVVLEGGRGVRSGARVLFDAPVMFGQEERAQHVAVGGDTGKCHVDGP